MMAIMTSVRWSFIVVLICISLMVRDVEHIFPWLLAIRISSLEKCLFSSAHLKKNFFFNWVVVAIYMCWILIPFGHIICKYFLLSIYCLFIFVSDFLCCAKAICPICLFLLLFTLGARSKNILLHFVSKSVLPMFSSKSSIVSDLTFRCLIHLSYFCRVWENIRILFFACSCPISGNF